MESKKTNGTRGKKTMSLEKTKVSGYFRDTTTQVIVNKNQQEYDQYMAGRKRIQELNKLNEEVVEMKKLLQQLLDKAT